MKNINKDQQDKQKNPKYSVEILQDEEKKKEPVNPSDVDMSMLLQ